MNEILEALLNMAQKWEDQANHFDSLAEQLESEHLKSKFEGQANGMRLCAKDIRESCKITETLFENG